MKAAAFGWIALGGATGSILRALGAHLLPTRFPWATLLVKVVGSLLAGWLMARLGSFEPSTASRWHGALVVGFCGGFTTFSTFSRQTLEQIMKGNWRAASANILLTVTLSLAMVWLGYRFGRI